MKYSFTHFLIFFYKTKQYKNIAKNITIPYNLHKVNYNVITEIESDFVKDSAIHQLQCEIHDLGVA